MIAQVSTPCNETTLRAHPALPLVRRSTHNVMSISVNGGPTNSR
jgi:hypothetical protein